MSPYVRHMVGSVFRSVGRVSKVSENLLFLNIINVEERCRAIFRNNQLPFCAFIASLGWELDIKTRTFSRLAIDFEFQSKIVRNWSLPVARNRYPLPGYRNGVPCFHWDIRFLENLSVRLNSSTKKHFFFISGHF